MRLGLRKVTASNHDDCGQTEQRQAFGLAEIARVECARLLGDVERDDMAGCERGERSAHRRQIDVTPAVLVVRGMQRQQRLPTARSLRQQAVEQQRKGGALERGAGELGLRAGGRELLHERCQRLELCRGSEACSEPRAQRRLIGQAVTSLGLGALTRQEGGRIIESAEHAAPAPAPRVVRPARSHSSSAACSLSASMTTRSLTSGAPRSARNCPSSRCAASGTGLNAAISRFHMSRRCTISTVAHSSASASRASGGTRMRRQEPRGGRTERGEIGHGEARG